jgi:hypothetical protein
MSNTGGEPPGKEKMRQVSVVLARKMKTRPGQNPRTNEIVIETLATQEPDMDSLPKSERVRLAALELRDGRGLKEARRWPAIRDVGGKYLLTQKDLGDLDAALKELAQAGETERKLTEARQKLEDAKSDSSGVSITAEGIEVHLDTAQQKHQATGEKIGERVTGSGTRFNNKADEQWHRDNTLTHMLEWAQGLKMTEGDVIYHGQTRPVNQVCYEGFCVFIDDVKYVSFHCYPARGLNNQIP